MAIAGTLRHVDVPSLLELARQLSAAKLELFTPQHHAAIYVQHNEVVHAAIGARTGLTVLHDVLAVKQGIFVLHEEVEASERSIHMPWNALLVEGLQQLDEQSFAEETADSSNDLLSAFPLGEMAISYENGQLRLSGAIGSDGVENLIEMALQMDKPARLAVTSRGNRYEAYTLAQKVVHAANGNAKGTSALVPLLSSRSGSFELAEGIFPPEVTINQEWRELYENVHAQQVEQAAKHLAPVLQQIAARLGSTLHEIGLVEQSGEAIVSYQQRLAEIGEQVATLVQLSSLTLSDNNSDVVQEMAIQVGEQRMLTHFIPTRNAYLITIVQSHASLDDINSTLQVYLPQLG